MRISISIHIGDTLDNSIYWYLVSCGYTYVGMCGSCGSYGCSSFGGGSCDCIAGIGSGGGSNRCMKIDEAWNLCAYLLVYRHRYMGIHVSIYESYECLKIDEARNLCAYLLVYSHSYIHIGCTMSVMASILIFVNGKWDGWMTHSIQERTTPQAYQSFCSRENNSCTTSVQLKVGYSLEVNRSSQ